MKFYIVCITKHFPVVSGILCVLILFLFTSISCADQPVDSLKKDSPKYLSFYETVDGERIHWEANFYGDDITSIYKNGKRIPDDLVDDYKYKVYDQLDEMRFGSRSFSFRMDDFHFDMNSLHENLEELKEKLKDQKLHLNKFKFDDDFKKEMKELKKNLEQNKSQMHLWKFDEKNFREEMEKLEKELKEKFYDFQNYKLKFEFEKEENTEA